MNGATVKAKNRELRKAFGAEALDHIAGLGTRIDALEGTVTALFNSERTLRHEADTRVTSDLTLQIRALEQALTAFRTAPWYRRAWWLVTGRA